jgi:hypothetical protein
MKTPISTPHMSKSTPANTHAISPKCSEFLRIVDERNFWIPSNQPHSELRSRVKAESPAGIHHKKCPGKMHTGSLARYNQYSGKSRLIDELSNSLTIIERVYYSLSTFRKFPLCRLDTIFTSFILLRSEPTHIKSGNSLISGAMAQW